MTYIMQSLYGIKTKINKNSDNFLRRHPYLSYLLAFILMPIITLTLVLILTTVIMLPISFVCGWL